MTTAWLVANLWHHSLQLAVLVALVGVALTLLRVNAPRFRLAALQATLGVALALPLQAWWVDAAEPPMSAQSVAMVAAEPSGTRLSVPVSSAVDWASIVVALYVAGMAGRAAWLGIGIAGLRRRGRTDVPDPVFGEVHELQRRLGTAARIEWCDGLAHPHTFGLWPAVVLLPSALGAQPSEVRRAVTCHELVHVRRHDWALVLVEEVARVVLWFHPAVWWLVAEIRLAREQVVDREVVTVIGNQPHYIGALLSFADIDAVSPASPSVSFFGRRQLVRRVSALLMEVRMSRVRLVLTTLVLGGAGGTMGHAASLWFPIDAPPRHRLEAAQQRAEAEPGALERQAVVFAPGMRAPRRVTTSEIEVPMERWPLLKGVTLTLRVVLDASGAVGETRLLQYQPDLTAGDDSAAVDADAMALADYLQDRVREWRYEPPPVAPLAMTFAFAYRAGTSGWSIGSSARQAEAALAAMNTRMEARRREGRSDTGSAIFFPEGAGSISYAPDGSVRVGGATQPPEKLVNANPIYPAEARAAGVQGIVILEVKIAEDGSVEEARVLRSIPLLDQAAIDAVRQWRYSPTLVNGSPMKVTLTLTINFILP